MTIFLVWLVRIVAPVLCCTVLLLLYLQRRQANPRTGPILLNCASFVLNAMAAVVMWRWRA